MEGLASDLTITSGVSALMVGVVFSIELEVDVNSEELARIRRKTSFKVEEAEVIDGVDSDLVSSGLFAPMVGMDFPIEFDVVGKVRLEGGEADST